MTAPCLVPLPCFTAAGLINHVTIALSFPDEEKPKHNCLIPTTACVTARQRLIDTLTASDIHKPTWPCSSFFPQCPPLPSSVSHHPPAGGRRSTDRELKMLTVKTKHFTGKVTAPK